MSKDFNKGDVYHGGNLGARVLSEDGTNEDAVNMLIAIDHEGGPKTPAAQEAYDKLKEALVAEKAGLTMEEVHLAAGVKVLTAETRQKLVTLIGLRKSK